jgi:hypothetical protein
MTDHQPFQFYKILPDGRFEFFVDASLLKSFSLCEAYFHLKHIKNLRPKSLAVTKPFAMAVGSWWSDVMEQFYNAIRDGRALDRMAIEGIALSAWASNGLEACAAMEPDRFEKFGNLAGAVLMLKEYYDSQYLIDVQNWKIISVEQGFGLKKEVLLGETRSSVVYWIGKPDLVVVENNSRLTPVDHKTVTRIDGMTTSRYKPSTQMPGYAYACEIIAKQIGLDVRVDRVIINICAREKPSDNPRGGKAKKPRFIRAYPNFTREEIAEWKRQVIMKCDRLAHCLRTNEWAWSETTCHSMYMRPCEFLKMHSITPSARDTVLLADFQESQPWVPYQTAKEIDE